MQDALRETSDQLLRDLDALVELEQEKRGTPEGDDRLVALASRVETIARRVLAGSQRQHDLSKVISVRTDQGHLDPTATIEEADRSPSDILGDWRAAERALQLAEPGSVEALEARTRADRLRDEYRSAFDRRPR